MIDKGDVKSQPSVEDKANHILAVPFYQQASEFTCGPACLIMAMRFFKPSLRTTRELEFDIWREANLVESYGTSKEGLALAAARRGFDVYTIGKPLRHSFVDEIADKVPGIDYKMLELLYDDTKAKFKSMFLKNVSSRLELPKLMGALERSQVPILLTSTSLFGEKEGLPHWVVVTGYGKDRWYINNPLAKQPNTKINHRVMEQYVGYHGIRCALIVRGLRLDKPRRSSKRVER
jgi:ABC-type bacteriocin/lantibiotic exporter with double-glycine peptidase domain